MCRKSDMNELITHQKLALKLALLAEVTMLFLSSDETACLRSLTESTHCTDTPLTCNLFITCLALAD